MIPERLKGLYSTAYRQVLFAGQPWVHPYECSSPTVYRSFRMTVSRGPGAQHLTVHNKLLTRKAHGESRPSVPADAAHQDADLDTPPRLLIHGLCQSCSGKNCAAPPGCGIENP